MKAIINDDGFVVGARILDRQRIFQELPEISIIGGGGFGAKLLASLACLDTEQLSTIGATKIGTGQYLIAHNDTSLHNYQRQYC